MAEFKISRIRYTWRGAWQTSTAYNRDDIVSYGGSAWVCSRKHTASVFQNDQEYYANQNDTDYTPAWFKMAEGLAFRGEWAPSTLYNVGDVIKYAGVLYLCTTSYTSTSTFDDNLSDLNVYASAIKFRGSWEENTRYGIGDVVRYGGNNYYCIIGHTSSTVEDGTEIGNDDGFNDSTLELWSVYYDGIEYKGDYAADIRYKLNELVTYNGTLLRCIAGYTSDSTFDDTKWTVELYGSEFESDWVDNVYYGIGSVVRNGGYLFYAIEANYNKAPMDSIYQQGPVIYWTILTEDINFRGTWSAAETYKTGDVVRRGGDLYKATLDTTDDGSTLDYIDESNWKRIAVGQNWRSAWSDGASYGVNDIVLFSGKIYKCTVEHVASDENFPGDNGSGFNYWDIVVQNYKPAGLKSRGDLLTYNLSRSNVGDGSTFDVTNVAKGDQNTLLTIDDEDTVIYKRYGEINRVFYVTTHGVDDTIDPIRGTSEFKPWRTIRFAAEQADDGFAGFTTIKVDAGEYSEILPIIVPARTVILGSELRSTTITAASANENLSGDYTYTSLALDRISSIIQTLIAGTDLSPPKTVSNTLDPVLIYRDITTQVPVSPPQVDDDGNPITETVVIGTEQITGSTQSATAIQSLIEDIKEYIDFYLNSSGTVPTLTGTNTRTSDSKFIDATLVLTANKDFLAEEAVEYIKSVYTSYNFDETQCKRDIRAFVDSWIYDITYTGNYKSILAARYYRNAVLGSETEDMFYLRDATGLRDCTLTGLTGTVSPPNVFNLYKRPTGGAFCSLDPGWGPNDDRTWILTRSPYIQGVTTIGTNCVGQKIDGSLHNGGNKSFVSNDFTQVLSDGIGAWVTNNGRAELVSVFTYYCLVGYLAEEGGIIRATNGNNSYGNYGAIADGVDPSETPGTATVTNRNNEAIVAAAFAGDFVDEIQILEYSNAGQDYTQASASFVGAGVNAEVVFEEFRDDAVFECRLLDANEGTEIVSQSIGGGGYSVVQSNAQTGDTTSITIASNDPNEEADYLGMRLILTSGPGTGQYGYITSYDTNTKIVTISRESNNQPGWDHVRPGFPIENLLGTQTTYRIEPRVIFSDPGFEAIEDDLGVATYWTKIAYGETYEVYTNIPFGAGTGTVIETPPVTAVISVIKNGRDYSVTFTNRGAGYEVGQTSVIPGNLIGGVTPYNDLAITVTSVSDDSTNSIMNYTVEGNGFSGRFVVIGEQGGVAVYSSDGDSWDAAALPSVGNWRALAAGKDSATRRHIFVAIKNNSADAASSFDGITWTARSMPSSQNWNSVVYGDGIFVAVAGNNDAGAISTNGITWSATTLPDSVDSSTNEWVDIAYGKQRFVALANSNNIVGVGTWNGSTMTWQSSIMDVIADSSQKDWISIAYGNDRFVAISTTGDIAYSFDGLVWSPGTMPTQDGSTPHYWRSIKYAQGVFFAVGDTGGRVVSGSPTAGPTTFAATSYDGINWTGRNLNNNRNWVDVGFGNPFIDDQDSSVGKSTPMWIAISNLSNIANKIYTGARALGRVTVSAGIIGEVRIWEPGSGYRNDPPTLTLVDPNNTADALVENRTGDGVLAQPSWINRGLGYRTATTRVTITGDGFADIIPTGKFVTLTDLEKYYGPGAQLRFSGNDEVYTIVTIQELGQINGGLTAYLRISPELKARDKLEHGTTVSVRERYSQCRITGHDFLDIGSGNFEETNYPELYSTGIFNSAPENEVYEEDGGRVFYTATDQSGNFRCGELFAVEQATGIVTISADFFDLQGLTELRLGGIRVGGSGAVIREFSTDPLFTEDSNNVVPTQRAIAAYLANRLTIGGSEIATSSFIAGTIKVGPDQISNVAGLSIIFEKRADFDQPNSAISGSMLAQTMFYRSFT